MALLLISNGLHFSNNIIFLIGLSIDGLSAVHNRYRISGNGNPTFEKVVKALNLLQEYGVEFNTLTVINDQNWQKGRKPI